MGVLLLLSSFMALVIFQRLLSSSTRSSCSVSSTPASSCLCLAVAAFRAMLFSTVGLFYVFSLASAILSCGMLLWSHITMASCVATAKYYLGLLLLWPHITMACCVDTAKYYLGLLLLWSYITMACWDHGQVLP